MADEETPYENLDVGYIEFPMPTTEEITAIRFLNKIGVARLWNKIKDKFVKIPSGGTTGQALVKTETSIEWGDVATDIPEATEEVYGTVIFASDTDFDEYMGLI